VTYATTATIFAQGDVAYCWRIEECRRVERRRILRRHVALVTLSDASHEALRFRENPRQPGWISFVTVVTTKLSFERLEWRRVSRAGDNAPIPAGKSTQTRMRRELTAAKKAVRTLSTHDRAR
jgi:hypothetical protein